MVRMKRLTADEVYKMEDHEYRDLMRGELQRARKNQGKRSSMAGSVVISILLLLAVATVLLHHMGMIDLPK